MLWQIAKEYLSVFSIGILIGFLITRYYYEEVSKHSLGKIIESALITDEVVELYKQTKELDTLLDKIRFSSDSLFDKVRRSRDIENRLDDVQNLNLDDFLYQDNIENENKDS